ncbi:hypothetical protein ACI65C_010115 [Semiaphis heraclei]
MASKNIPPEIPPRRHSSTVSPNKIINQNSTTEPKSPAFLPRRHSSCIEDNMDSETDTSKTFWEIVSGFESKQYHQ